jgi:chromosome segregation ATPase
VAKSPTELIRDLTAQVGVLSERDATRRAELEELKTRIRQELDERKVAEAQTREELTQLRRELAEARQENAVLKQQLQDHVGRYQEWERRRWSLIVLLVGAVMSLASGLIVTLAKK